ncbi:MAG: hypothetical protein U0T02_00105 [Solirubrobacteraceae bacterium]
MAADASSTRPGGCGIETVMNWRRTRSFVAAALLLAALFAITGAQEAAEGSGACGIRVHLGRGVGEPAQVIARHDRVYACWAPSGRLSLIGRRYSSSLTDGNFVPSYTVGGRYVLYVVRAVDTRSGPADDLVKLDARSGRRRSLFRSLRCPVSAPDLSGQTGSVQRGVFSPVIDARGSAAWACITLDGLVQRLDKRGVAVLDSWRIDQSRGPFAAPVLRLRGTRVSWRIPGRGWRSARLVDR